MSGPSEEERLKRLAERLATHRKAQEAESAPRAPEDHTQAQMAWRMVTELVAGLLVGFGIGMGLDALFGTRPWLLVIFTLLGFAAGVQTMLRTAREMQRAQGGTRNAAAGKAPTDRQKGNGQGG
jgi:ATP synthase protein I